MRRNALRLLAPYIFWSCHEPRPTCSRRSPYFVSHQGIQSVARRREQPEREDRIIFEIVVDAYSESERALSWYYYLDEKIKFPFKANCTSVRATSPLEVGSEVEVLVMATEDDCMIEVYVFVQHGTKKKSKLAVPLAQLQCLSTNEETRQAVEDWHYWVARGYEY